MNSPATNLNRNADNSWRVTVGANEIIDADTVILAAPAFRAGQLLEPIAAKAAAELKNISYASTATVSVAYRREDFPRAPDSFGFVVPALEKRKIMACTFSSLKYPGRAPDKCVLMRAFVGGSLQPELFTDDDQRWRKMSATNWQACSASPPSRYFSRIWRHPNSMPQYHVGHEARVKRIETALQRFPTLALAGSAYHGVGISDCVRTGEEAAEKVLTHLFPNP